MTPHWERGNAGAWGLKRCCVNILVNIWFEYMLFVRSEQELPYSHKLRDAIDANMEVAEGYPKL